MKREDIIRMRREADKFADEVCFGEIERTCENMELVSDERFAKLIAAKEREACMGLAVRYGAPADLRAAIRARGEA